MRFLFLGDIVGRSGRDVVLQSLPVLISDLSLDFVVVNGENSARGFGISEKIYLEIINAGVNSITTGNHVFNKREIIECFRDLNRLLRPANFPKGTPGRGMGVFFSKNGARVLVSNVMGNIFMYPNLDDPFKTAELVLNTYQMNKNVDAIIFDFHAEATSEKQCFGHFLDSRVSVVIGTHTHVPTADAQILNGGTAYISDAGMCGDYNSIIGMEKKEPLQRFLTKIPRSRYQVASGIATICGLAVEISDRTGLAEKVSPLRIGPRIQEIIPNFW